MKKTLIILFIIITGCTKYRELLKTDSINCKLTADGRFIYENDTVKITYSFWAENGVMNMRIYNKLNVPIFIDWKVSNFIDNNNNLQYWYDVQNSTSVNKNISYYGLQTITGIPASLNKGITNTSIEHPDRIVSITPHSSIKNVSYSILAKNTYVSYNNVGKYTFDNSPIKFRNYLAFSIDEAFTKKFYVDNQFYVSHTELIKEKQFEVQKDSGGYFYQISPYKNPTCFYTIKLNSKN